MSTYTMANLFNIYDVLTTEQDPATGTLTAQLGDATNSEVLSENAEIWSHFGFASRPSNVEPNADNAPQVIAIARSDRDLVVAERDTRGQEIYGQLGPGETCLYAGGVLGTGQARVLLKADGAINLYTKAQNDVTKPGMGIFLNAMDDSVTIMNSKGLGIRIDNEHGVMIKGLNENTIILGEKLQLGDIEVGNIDIGGGCNVMGSLGVVGPTMVASLTAGETKTGALTAGVTTTGALKAATITGLSVINVIPPSPGTPITSAMPIALVAPV